MEKILVVIDMQNDFIDGSLGTPEAVAIVDNVVNKINTYKANNIYATRDVHCVKDTFGWQINSKVANAIKNSVIIDKPSFGSLELAEMLRKRSEKEDIEIELVGLCTDICVVSNAMILKAYMPEVKISVDGSCCAGVTKESHFKALDTMKMCQINVK